LQPSPIVRFSEFLGIGYFGDASQHAVAPIFDQRHNAVSAWAKVTESQRRKIPSFHVVFVEHPAKYEFVAAPTEVASDRINYALYRSFSSLDSMHKFRDSHQGKTYIKFGWHDLTRAQRFDVLAEYGEVDSLEFVNAEKIRQGSIIDQIRKDR
jgi:hypothetical protein